MHAHDPARLPWRHLDGCSEACGRRRLGHGDDVILGTQRARGRVVVAERRKRRQRGRRWTRPREASVVHDWRRARRRRIAAAAIVAEPRRRRQVHQRPPSAARRRGSGVGDLIEHDLRCSFLLLLSRFAAAASCGAVASEHVALAPQVLEVAAPALPIEALGRMLRLPHVHAAGRGCGRAARRQEHCREQQHWLQAHARRARRAKKERAATNCTANALA